MEFDLYLARSQFALLHGVRRARCFVADRLQWVSNAARSVPHIASRRTCSKMQIVTAQGIVNNLWRRSPPAANTPYHKWLVDRGSLTERIKERSKNFKVVRCFQGVSSTSVDELFLIGLGHKQYAHVREVILVANDQPVVFAHSVAMLKDINGAWRSVGKLGARPLAEALFANPKVSRLEMEYCQINSRHYLYKKMKSYRLPLSKRFWARRSLFLLKGHRLLVTEIFLPSICNVQI